MESNASMRMRTSHRYIRKTPAHLHQLKRTKVQQRYRSQSLKALKLKYARPHLEVLIPPYRHQFRRRGHRAACKRSLRRTTQKSRPLKKHLGSKGRADCLEALRKMDWTACSQVSAAWATKTVYNQTKGKEAEGKSG